MSDVHNANMNQPSQQNNGNGNANFDTTTGPGNRDAWNRPIKQDNKGSGDNKDNKDNKDSNNTGIDEELIANIFDKIENKDTNNNTNTDTNTNVQVDEKVQLEKYLKDNGLGGIEFGEAEKEAATNGDFGPMMAKVNSYVINSHMKSLSGSQTMIQKAVQDAMKEAGNKASQNYMGHKNLDAMNEALPFTKEKHIAPVAASILQKALDRGLPTDKAVAVVEAYFNDIGSRVGGSNNVNTNRNGNFNSDNKGDKKQNWLNILSPGN